MNQTWDAAQGRSSGSRRQGLAIASLVIGILSLPTVGLLFVGAIVGIILGVVALVKANRQPAIYGGKGLAIAGIALNALSILVMPFFIGIIAAIAIPSLLRARVSANESAAIGDIRSVISAEAAYQSASGGSYGTLECLAAPKDCIPGYSGPDSILDRSLLATTKTGYRRQFYPGPPSASASGTSSLATYAYVAVPVTVNRTGIRGFCGDSTGVICQTRDGSEPEVVNGACVPSSCQPLR